MSSATSTPAPTAATTTTQPSEFVPTSSGAHGEVDANVEMWKMKRLIKSLQSARG